MAAGKHVICEKPLALTAKEGIDLVNLTDKTGLVNATCFNTRFYPMVHEARSLVKSDLIGAPRYIKGHYHQDWLTLETDWNWRLEAEQAGELRAVADIGSHLIDQIGFVSGLEISEVMAELHTLVKTRQKPTGPVQTFTIDTSSKRESVKMSSDDAAGVAISSRLSSELRGTNQSVRNALDAQALIDTAEGAHKEVENILQRMRELAIQAANGTNNADDITNLEAEFTALSTEITRIGETTTWAGKALTGTDATAFSFQVGSGTATANQISVTINSIKSADIGNGTDELSDVVTAGLDDLTESMAAIVVIDDAIKEVNTQRSELGAVFNRLNHTVNNLTNISGNLVSALGRIQDTDYAAEITALAKHQILQKAAIAMLAQANASKSYVLTLLRSLN